MVDRVVTAWLAVVDEDIRAIRACLVGSAVKSAAYHCQQAAEKLVKAVLVSFGRHPPKQHNIVALLDDVPPDHPLRATLLPLERFTIYAAAFRYPSMDIFDGPPDEPDPDDVSHWLAEIEQVRATVSAFLEAKA
ncbi:HEPN domain-containing protein [Azospirillum sp. TSH64]|uniref:HEPN domain-containing protein n=1 Tax=Azospirillum sp. TSH64 TaxID=652740 RepID=UPI000D68D92D|nr:HEPN domain-containing protein [Azospirillum sp. TSH64]